MYKPSPEADNRKSLLSLPLDYKSTCLSASRDRKKPTMSVTDPYTLGSKEELFLLASADQGPKDRKGLSDDGSKNEKERERTS